MSTSESRAEQTEQITRMSATVHDSGYKRLFSNKTIFRQLIETFVEEEWVPQLDFDRAELSNKNVRHLLLPAMFPLVLYNGDEAWTAPDQLETLIEKAVDLGGYGLHFKHLVIAENEFGKEALLRIRNIISTLFLAESHYDYELLRDELLNLCDTEQDVQALELFINWLRQLAHHGKINPVDFARMEAQYRTREEMKSMLIKALEQERDTLRQEGYDLGEQKGIEKGKLEAQRQTTLRLVQWRFAPTAAEQARYAAHLERIDNLEALLHLVDQVLTQPTLAAFVEALQAHLPPTDQ